MRQQTVHCYTGILIEKFHFISGITFRDYYNINALLLTASVIEIFPMRRIIPYPAYHDVFGVDSMTQCGHNLVIIII